MKVYISGPMKGISDLNRESFFECEKVINRNGYTAVNPHRLSPRRQEGETDAEYYERCMTADLAALEDCDSIFMLPGWRNSGGAVREHNRAVELKLEIMESRA